MTTSRRVIGLLAALGLGIGAGVGGDRWWLNRTTATAARGNAKPESEQPPADDEEPEPAAVVRTVTATTGELPRVVDALGVAAIPPTATSIVSWPTDVLVIRVLVQAGDSVSDDTPLMQVTPTRDAETQHVIAQLATENASKALDAVNQRLDRGLATKTDLIAAQSAYDEAKQKLERLQAGQPPKDGVLRPHTAGTVTAVRVQPGATVTAGSPLVDVASNAVVAQIGLDPADAPNIAVGQVFELQAVDERVNGRWKGIVSLLARTVNPTTRLVDTTLTFEGAAPPRPGTALRARASMRGEQGVLVPRAALVPDGDAFVVFLVRNGTCVRTPVHVVLTGRDQVVVNSGCASGDHVIVGGQSQLAPGATVREVASDSKADTHSGGDGADH